MRKFTLEVDEKSFNLLWHSLCAREDDLLAIIKEHEDDESEIGPMASNDLVYLRLYKKELKEQAEKAVFGENVFNISDEIIDLSKL